MRDSQALNSKINSRMETIENRAGILARAVGKRFQKLVDDIVPCDKMTDLVLSRLEPIFDTKLEQLLHSKEETANDINEDYDDKSSESQYENDNSVNEDFGMTCSHRTKSTMMSNVSDTSNIVNLFKDLSKDTTAISSDNSQFFLPLDADNTTNNNHHNNYNQQRQNSSLIGTASTTMPFQTGQLYSYHNNYTNYQQQQQQRQPYLSAQ